MTNTGMLPLMAVRAVLVAEAGAGFMIHLTSSVKSLEAAEEAVEAVEAVASLKIYLEAADAILRATGERLGLEALGATGGKLETYLRRHVPVHVEMLVAAGILDP